MRVMYGWASSQISQSDDDDNDEFIGTQIHKQQCQRIPCLAYQ